MASNAFTNPVTFTADVTGLNLSGYYYVEGAYFMVDGTQFPATVSDNCSMSGPVTVNLSQNPSQHNWYAVVSVYVDYEGYDFLLYTMKSTNLPQGAEGATAPYGDGWEAQFINADIRIDGVTWMNRATPYIHDSVATSNTTTNPTGVSVDYPSMTYPSLPYLYH